MFAATPSFPCNCILTVRVIGYPTPLFQPPPPHPGRHADTSSAASAGAPGPLSGPPPEYRTAPGAR
eukprot:748822-Hanusia_phi.AAC.5